jgi:hypothetical protein
VISEPPTGDRWDPALISELQLAVVARGTVIRFDRQV